MDESSSAFKMLTGKPTGKRPLGKPRWRDSIIIDLKEIGDSAEYRHYWRALVNAALNLQVS